MNIFFLVFFVLYASVNLYIFVRSWQALEFVHNWRYLFALFFLFSSVAYFIAKIFSDKLPFSLYFLAVWVGSFWFFVVLYGFLSVLVIDFIRILNSGFHFLPKFLFSNLKLTKFLVFTLVFSIIALCGVLGYYNRSSIKVKELKIELNQKGKEYKIVFFSDLHISVINNHKFLDKLIEKINELHPDVILIGGDLVDEKSNILEKYGLVGKFKELKTKYGIFAITGNHEYINGANYIVEYLERNCNIKFLRDTAVLINDSFYLIGREDRSIRFFANRNRKTISELLKNLPQGYSTILLDHQPLNLDEAVSAGIDLQLSGHTHNGQIFPLNFITNLVYEVSWGYKRKGNTHFYVSSGVGTWGPPLKIGNNAEIVLIRLNL